MRNVAVGGAVQRGMIRRARSVGRGSREGEREREASPSARLALDANPAAMGLDDPLRDREPEADAGTRGLPRLPEAVEDVWEVLGRDARAGVADRELDRGVTSGHADLDPSVLGSEL